MTPTQSKMARAALDLSLHDLASMAGIARLTVQRFEKGSAVAQSSVEAIKAALEGAGIAFIGDSEVSRAGGAGVRLSR